MSQEPLISVIIPTYQRCSSVKRILQALSCQTLPAEQFEVLVVIDGSMDGTLEMVEQFQAPFRLRGIWQANQGRATACNCGIRAALGKLVLILDDDMEPSPRLLQLHTDAHHSDSSLGVLGPVPVLLEPSSQPVVQFIGTKFNQHLEKLAQPGYNLNLRDFYSSNFSIPRAILMDIGLFDEHFKVYGNEDLELFWKLRQAGIRLMFCKEAVATQYYEKDYSSLARDNINKGKTSMLFARMHPEAMPEIKLSTYNQETYKWRLLRACLLTLSRFWKSLPGVMMRFMSWLERRRPVNLPLYYRLSLDYFYWLGVRNAES